MRLPPLRTIPSNPSSLDERPAIRELNPEAPRADTHTHGWDVRAPLPAEELRRGSQLNIMPISVPTPLAVTGQTPEPDIKDGKKVTD